MKLLKNGESGQALIMALILLALGSLLIVPTLNLVSTSNKYHQLIECKTLGSYSADSGVEYALCELYNNPNEYADPETPLQESFTINGRSVNVTGEYQGGGVYKMTSTATGGGCGSTTIECHITLSIGVFAFAIATTENMTLQDTTVDSSPDPGEGNIHSNANISLTDCVINGGATTVGTISSANSSVTGMVIEGTLPVGFPADYSALYEQMAKEGGTWEGNYIITGGTEYLGPLYINGDLRVEDDATVILEGTVYVTGMISVEDSNLDGDETIVAEGSIRIEQGGVRSDIIPIIISLKVDGEIYSEWGTTVDGVLYAPYGRIRLENGVHLYGATAGKTVTIQNCTITYAKQLHGREDVPGGELHTITYSFK